MPVIYEPNGKAREYSELAVNLYTGCLHGCKYCYCPSIIRKSLEEWSGNHYARTKIISKIEKEAEKLYGCDKELLMCFMCDPYQDEEAAFLTRQALLIFEKNKFKKINVLTKAGYRAVKDFDIIARNKWKFGSTIIFRCEELRKEWEPNAPSIQSRYEAVKIAHDNGIYSWVSIEPVVNTEESLKVIDDLIDIVDYWKVGKLNHYKSVEETIDWTKFYNDVIKLLNGKEYLIKKDLLKFANTTRSSK
jgi:DNA repair photolyase